MARTTATITGKAPTPRRPRPATDDTPPIKASPHRVNPEVRMTTNVAAFAHMLKVSEGTAGVGDDGYNVLVGSRADEPHLFESYADHPRVLVPILNGQGQPVLGTDGQPLKSTAAGAYQILARYFDAYKASLGLADFAPAAQDAIMLQMLREVGAVDLLNAGKFTRAVYAASSRWASLPGNDYGQHQNNLDTLRRVYLAAGGGATD